MRKAGGNGFVRLLPYFGPYFAFSAWMAYVVYGVAVGVAIVVLGPAALAIVLQERRHPDWFAARPLVTFGLSVAFQTELLFGFAAIAGYHWAVPAWGCLLASVLAAAALSAVTWPLLRSWPREHRRGH